MGKTVKMSFEGKSQQEPRNWQMDRILNILKKENGPRASSAPALGLNTMIFKHVYWYMQQTQVSVYRTIGPLVIKIKTTHQSLVVKKKKQKKKQALVNCFLIYKSLHNFATIPFEYILPKLTPCRGNFE